MNDLVPRLTPPETKPHASVARVVRGWYVACEARELAAKPLARTILGTPLVLFRGDDGTPAALLDRCAHRNVPLSLGRVCGARLQCGYHGWEFDGEGVCRHVPGLVGEAEGKGRRVPAYACREQQGYIWVWGEADAEPVGEPYRLPYADTAGYATVRRRVFAPATLHATVENALDVPHTAYLHAGLFRGSGDRNTIEAIVRRGPDRVEAEYVGEPRPEGLAGRLLAPGGGVVEHWDRFILPSVAEVEYRIGDDAHLHVSSLCTPVSDFETRMYAAVSFKLRFPAWLVKLVLQPIGLRIFKQDVVILSKQTEAIHRFGGEQYVSTDLDLLGPAIWRLLKEAERGDIDPDAETVELKRVSMSV